MNAAAKIGGFLEVGVNDQHEIVINHPDLLPDANGVGHIVFSIGQAEEFVTVLQRKIAEAKGIK